MATYVSAGYWTAGYSTGETGGGTSYTLTGNAGSYSLSGGSVTLTKTVGATAYSLTANAGTYSLSGGTAALSLGRKITATAGSYSLTGGTAALKVGRKITANAGTYSLTGGSATLTKTAGATAYALTALAGSYAITGGSAVLKAGRTLTALAGSYSIAGGSATLAKTGATAYALTGEAGIYAMFGGDAVLAWSGEATEQMPAGVGNIGQRTRKKPRDLYWNPTTQRFEEAPPATIEQAVAVLAQAPVKAARKVAKTVRDYSGEVAELERLRSQVVSLQNQYAQKLAEDARLSAAAEVVRQFIEDEEDATALIWAATMDESHLVWMF